MEGRGIVVAGYNLPTREGGQCYIPPGFSVADRGQSSHQFLLLTREDGSWAVIRDVASHGADDTRGEKGVAKLLEDALDEWAAKDLVEPGWRQCAEIWVTPVCDDVASLANGVDTAKERWHEVLGEQPVQHVSEVMGADPALSNVLGGIAREVALPGDTWIKDMKRAFQYSGIAIGVMSGNLLLANACLKSLVHDLILEKASREAGKVLSGKD